MFYVKRESEVGAYNYFIALTYNYTNACTEAKHDYLMGKRI